MARPERGGDKDSRGFVGCIAHGGVDNHRHMTRVMLSMRQAAEVTFDKLTWDTKGLVFFELE
jgi:hypothetical protein